MIDVTRDSAILNDRATEAIDAVEAAGAALAQALCEEQTAEDGRAAAKVAAIRRLMDAGPNALTGKPHSASSAEAIVETDALAASPAVSALSIAQERSLEMACGDDEGTDDEVAA